MFAAFGSLSAKADGIKTVFVIAMENHNWTQPTAPFGPGVQQIFQNANAPFVNCLVDGSAVVRMDGHEVNISKQVAYATACHNVLATPSGNNPDIHPSEPNYLSAEAGTNFGVFNDNDPFSLSGPTDQNTTQHLVAFLTKAGKAWRSYQEDTDLATNGSGQLINVVFTGGYKGLTGDNANIKAGRRLPQADHPHDHRIEGLSGRRHDHHLVNESESAAGETPDNFAHTIGEIVISPLARNRNGVP